MSRRMCRDLVTDDMQAQKVAEQLAAALDAENYEAVGRLLSAECVYHSPDGPLIGPATIIASYRSHSTAGRERFEKIEYSSQVDATSPSEALITFFDRVKRNGRWHDFRCRQQVFIDAEGHVTEIRHEEIPGERERLRVFEDGAGGGRFGWGRVIGAIILAEALPILLLVAVVFVYGFLREEGSPSPAEFAPRAGNWVGPIGGFLATFLFAWWAARPAQQQKLAHAAAVGVGTALLDFGLALLLAGTDAIHPLLLVSNTGRILAGCLGGKVATRARPTEPIRVEPTS